MTATENEERTVPGHDEDGKHEPWLRAAMGGDLLVMDALQTV
jgi:hypothetical protein